MQTLSSRVYHCIPLPQLIMFSGYKMDGQERTGGSDINHLAWHKSYFFSIFIRLKNIESATLEGSILFCGNQIVGSRVFLGSKDMLSLDVGLGFRGCIIPLVNHHKDRKTSLCVYEKMWRKSRSDIYRWTAWLVDDNQMWHMEYIPGWRGLWLRE